MARTDRLTELAQTRLDYWRELMKRMRHRNSLVTFNEPSSAHQLRAKADTFGSGKFILVAQAVVRPELRVGVGVEIGGPEEYYVALEKDKFRIQNEIGRGDGYGQFFEWNPTTKVRDIWLYRYVDFFERQRWPEQHEWFCEKLEAFHRVLKPRIAELLRVSS